MNTEKLEIALGAFREYNHQAWLKLREARYKQIRDNNFYFGLGAENFKIEVLRFWEGGFNLRNSQIRETNGGWIPFLDGNAQIVNGDDIMRELEAGNLDLHGNCSWSGLHMGVAHGGITDDMPRLINALNNLFDENIGIAARFNYDF